jgi:hypothetical protein
MKHPSYGPCDTFMPDGSCSECSRGAWGQTLMSANTIDHIVAATAKVIDDAHREDLIRVVVAQQWVIALCFLAISMQGGADDNVSAEEWEASDLATYSPTAEAFVAVMLRATP